MITGSSVHNQWIERLWRDTYRCVLSTFHQIFYSLEDNQVLDPTSELDLFCLHTIYQPKINSALESFTAGWNNHAITTENNKTPMQLYACGVIFGNTDISSTTGDISLDGECNDLDAPSVVVPETINPLSAHHTVGLNTMLSHITDSDSSADYSIDTYLEARRYVRAHYSQWLWLLVISFSYLFYTIHLYYQAIMLINNNT